MPRKLLPLSILLLVAFSNGCHQTPESELKIDSAQKTGSQEPPVNESLQASKVIVGQWIATKQVDAGVVDVLRSSATTPEEKKIAEVQVDALDMVFGMKEGEYSFDSDGRFESETTLSEKGTWKIKEVDRTQVLETTPDGGFPSEVSIELISADEFHMVFISGKLICKRKEVEPATEQEDPQAFEFEK